MFMHSMKELVDAIHAGDANTITAASLGRLWQHTKDLSTSQFAMLTSWSSARAREENIKALDQLKADFRSRGLGYVTLIGHWKDEQEPSFFVPGIDLKSAHELGNKYQQQAIVYGGPDANGKVVLVNSDGSQEQLADKFTPQAVGDSFSELARKRGRKFTFVTSAAVSQSEFLSATAYESFKYSKPLYAALSSGSFR